tara:strand:+ start:100 stop:759 length:660 start_codon:yes stop_codon:yes gene_type:complete
MATNKKVTVVITCCGRLGLLRKTLESFKKYNTYPIEEFIIIDDTGDKKVHRKFLDEYLHKVNNTTIVLNQENIGQSKSIDKAYALVKTPYIFHLEEDWEFKKANFIQDSFKILDSDPKICTVWLRGLRNTNGHTWHEKELDIDGLKHYKLRVHKGTFSGFTWNPGLRRTEDYRLLPVFGDVTEETASSWYGNLGFHAMIMKDTYVRHTGWLNSVQKSLK